MTPEQRLTLKLEVILERTIKLRSSMDQFQAGALFLLDPLTSAQGKYFTRITFPTNVTIVSITANQGNFIEYVYSISSSAYPSAGVQGDYYYQKLSSTVTSPTAPANLQYPNPITRLL